MTLSKVVRKGSYQGVAQWGISTSAEITPSRKTAQKWAELENARNHVNPKHMPTNPHPPTPEFTTADFERFTAYGWKCLKHGIVAFGNTKEEAISLWFEAYRSEYNIPVN